VIDSSLPLRSHLVPSGSRLLLLYANRPARDIDSGAELAIASDLHGNETGFRVSWDGRRVSLHDGQSLKIWMSRGPSGKNLRAPTPPGLMVDGNPRTDPPADI
jgi:hypothetical protein